jgi:hypothetical protein
MVFYCTNCIGDTCFDIEWSKSNADEKTRSITRNRKEKVKLRNNYFLVLMCRFFTNFPSFFSSSLLPYMLFLYSLILFLFLVLYISIKSNKQKRLLINAYKLLSGIAGKCSTVYPVFVRVRAREDRTCS